MFGRFKKKQPKEKLANKPAGNKREKNRSQEPFFGGGVPDIADLVAPDVVDRGDISHMRLGHFFVQSLFVTVPPRLAQVGWLGPFLEHPGMLDLSIHIVPYDPGKAVDALTYAITRLETEKAFQRGNISMVQELETAIQDYWQLREAIGAKNLSTLHKLYVFANLYHKDKTELEQEAAFLETRLLSRMVHTRFADGRMDDAFLSVAPLGLNLLTDQYRNTNAEGVATVFPFVTADLAMEGGFLVGDNRFTGAPIFYNPFGKELNNHSVTIYAPAGSGKSATAKSFILRGGLTGIRFVVIDPEGEYRSTAQVMGGRVIRLGLSSSDRLNIFDVSEQIKLDEKDQPILGPDGQPIREVPLAEKFQDLMSFYQTMAGDIKLTPVEEAILQQVTAEEYAARGITTDPESLWVTGEKGYELDEIGNLRLRGERQRKAMPRIRDIYNRLLERGEDAKNVAAIFSKYLEGGPLGFLDSHSTVSLNPDDPVTVIDLSLVENPVTRTMVMHMALAWIWDDFIKRHPGVKKWVVVDEAWMFVDFPLAMAYLETFARRARKRTAGLVIISQDARKFLAHPKAHAINSNAATKVFLKQSSEDIGVLIEAFQLSEAEQEYLLTCDKGGGIMRVGGRSVAFQVVHTELEKNIVYTSPLLQKAAGS